MGTGEPSFFSSQPLSISSSRWLWVEISYLLCFYAFSALLLSPFSQLTFSQFWKYRGGNMSIGEPSLSSSQPLLISSLTVSRNFRLVMFLCFFCTFVISILILYCQSTISLLFIIHLEFWAWFSTINTSNEPNGRFRPFSHFRLLSQKCPRQQ